MSEEKIIKVAEKLAAGGGSVAFTGAGISVESGIPDFRSAGGLWDKFDPMEYATIEAFLRDPERVWEMLREMDDLLKAAEPNPAHLALARLEQLGVLAGVITQNVDNLHQRAGSREVIEFHGNGKRLVCLRCKRSLDAAEAHRRREEEFPPRCPDCRDILKPDVVFFGEPIPKAASIGAMRLAQSAPVMLVVGTSALVAPASYLPVVAKKTGALIVEINREHTVLTGDLADVSLRGRAGELLPRLVAAVENAFGQA
ncbi:MAG TPA: NAD-dependent deacylase [Myxococcota bacterium]|nr:NAD-dependent deacylase [Myxococcota bacterium]